MAYASYEEADYVHERLAPLLEKRIAEKGFVVLAWLDVGWVHFLTKTPVRMPNDMKALKLFTWAGDDKYTEIWKSAGFNPVPLPATEASTGLQTGLVNAISTTTQAAILMQWYDKARNITTVNWGLLIGGLVVTQKVWDQVPESLRPTLIAAARDMAQVITKETRDSEPADLAAMEKRGVTVIRPTAAEVDAWRKLAESTYQVGRTQFMPSEMFDRAIALRDEYRAKQGAAKGGR